MTSLIDKFYKRYNPEKALKREKARFRLNALGGFTGASKSRKSLSTWRTRFGGDPGQILLDDYSELVDRSYDLDRNNPLASGAISTLNENIIGSGLKVQSMIDHKFLRISPEYAKNFQREAERIFNLLACKKETFDAKAEQNFYEMQATAFISSLLSGDCFAQRQYEKNTGFLGTRWLLVDSKRVCNPNRQSDSRKISGGIERNAMGKVIKYHIATAHPDSTRHHIKHEWSSIRPESRDGYTKDFIHCFVKRTITEPRGRPILSPVIESLKQLGRYSEAELQAAVVSGLFTVYIKSPDGSADLDSYDGSSEESTVTDSDYSMGNGAVVSLAEGEDISTANPGRPNSGFDPFVLAILRQVGVCLGLPYELMIKHFTASYSASRAALNEAQKSFKMRRSWFANSFCQPIYESVIIEAVANGYLNAPGFFDDYQVRQAYLSTVWTGDAWGSLDPVKDVNAAEKRLSLGLTTRTQETLEINGGDYEKNAAQRAKELEIERELQPDTAQEEVQEDESIRSDTDESLGDDNRSARNNDEDSASTE